MKTVMLLGCIATLCAASTASSSVTISTTPYNVGGSRQWWGSDEFWSEDRFPRGGDVVAITSNMDYDAAGRHTSGPLYYYDGATEGSEIIIDEDTDLVVDDGDMIIGGQDNAPEACVVADAGWSNWAHGGVEGACSAACAGGTQTRSRTVTPPRYGGDSCPQSIEVQTCNTQACGCTDDGDRFHESGSVYADFGKNHCNECKCLHGTATCTQRVCHDNKQTTLCGHTTCVYGARFPGDDTVYTLDEAIATYGQNMPTHEMTTVVKHSTTGETGAFHCGHDGSSCKCYCSATGTHTIWHRANHRHQDAIDEGLTMAGCTCDSNGCDLTTNLCTFVPGTCNGGHPVGNTVTAFATKDVCGVTNMPRTHKLLLSSPIDLASLPVPPPID